jgi:UDP-2,3-diacylglucosamine pyrophosphatase LpxH
MKKPLQILHTTLHIGLPKPVRLLHITDTHITRDDPGRAFPNRYRCFNSDYENCAEDYFLQALEYARENNLPVVHTGDLLDYLSEANFAFVDEYFSPVDYLYAAGNHDFCHWVGRAKEDYAYKWEMMRRSAPHFNCNLYFDSRVIGGVNFITIDDSYYLFTEGQLELLKAEAARGLPMVVCMHNPLYEPELARLVMDAGNPCAYLTDPPEDVAATYPEDRRKQQTPDEATRRVSEFLRTEPLVKALITGHTHLNYVGLVDGHLPQITTHGSFAGFVREIVIE